jgi:hypothetical protein
VAIGAGGGIVRCSEMQTIGRSLVCRVVGRCQVALAGGIDESPGHPVSVENVEAFEVLLLQSVSVDSFGGGQR